MQFYTSMFIIYTYLLKHMVLSYSCLNQQTNNIIIKERNLGQICCFICVMTCCIVNNYVSKIKINTTCGSIRVKVYFIFSGSCGFTCTFLLDCCSNQEVVFLWENMVAYCMSLIATNNDNFILFF